MDRLKECSNLRCNNCGTFVICNIEKRTNIMIHNTNSIHMYWLDSDYRIYTKTKLENEIFTILDKYE